MKIKDGALMAMFGGTGDLAKKKLIPTLFEMYKKSTLPEKFALLVIGRKDFDRESYHLQIDEILSSGGDFEESKERQGFKSLVYYHKMDFNDDDAYQELKIHMEEVDAKNSLDGNRLFYLATSPGYFETISKNLKCWGLVENKDSWQRIMIEKPFGYDLESAGKLNRALTDVFEEEHIYRIDHYLGKEMIQNITYIRFANKIFEAVWNGKCIDNIQITATETIGIGERGGYYDKSGALRDMIQNHLFQIMALVMMERPKSFNPEDMRDEKVKLINAIRRYEKKDIGENIVFGQYEKNDALDGYREEAGVMGDSMTETFAGMKIIIDNERWRDTPVYLKTGKRLSKKEAYVSIQFRNSDSENSLFSECVCENILGIRIQPKEGVYLKFNMKEPGHLNDVKSVETDYCQSCDINYKSLESYEKLIADALNGDNTLFARWDEVESSWSFIDDLTELCCDEKKSMTEFYKAGSNGPERFEQLVEKDGRRWWKY